MRGVHVAPQNQAGCGLQAKKRLQALCGKGLLVGVAAPFPPGCIRVLGARCVVLFRFVHYGWCWVPDIQHGANRRITLSVRLTESCGSAHPAHRSQPVCCSMNLRQNWGEIELFSRCSQHWLLSFLMLLAAGRIGLTGRWRCCPVCTTH